MSEEKVLESIKETCSGSAGCSLRIKVAAYNLLDYINSNDNYDKIVNLICKYFNEEYDYKSSLTIPSDEIEYLLSTCCTFLLLGKKNNLDEVGLNPREYNEKEIVNFFKFANLINEKFEYQLKLDSINNLQLQRNLLMQEKLEKSIKDTENKIEGINDRIDKIHFDTISIISIFVAVIFALYGGTQLVSSIITKITSDNYVLMFRTALVLGLVLSIIISLLLSVMSWHDKKSNKRWILVVLNIILAIVTVLSWMIKIK